MQLAAMATTVGLALAGGAHYDVPRDYTHCPHAVAWHGFFRWASEEESTCQAAARFTRSKPTRRTALAPCRAVPHG